jgi:hypothetical protein
MRRATRFHRSLVSLAAFGLMALIGATQGEAADGNSISSARALAACPVQAGVDATGGLSQARDAAPPTADATPQRRIDWRAMLPAVTLRSRA